MGLIGASRGEFADSHKLGRISRRLKEHALNPSWVVERARRVLNIQTKDLCWIFGVGRSGSTWLSELLDGLHYTRVWHEPYFGTILGHPTTHPFEFERRDSFFSQEFSNVWQEGLRDLLLANARARFGKISPGTRIIIKDINAPQICPHFASVFPDSRYLCLIRDPFDVLDSFIDMSRPGSWGSRDAQESVEALAERIKMSMELSLSGYHSVREDHRLMVRYCDILDNPENELRRCTSFLELPVKPKEIRSTIESHRFEKHKERGRLAFRRFGKAGIWKESGNFGPQIQGIADHYLGRLRSDLGYR